MKMINIENGSKVALVRLGDVKPNPFRNIESYPILPSKVATLKASIEDTGFWENVTGRMVDGEIQIAYGHHRLAAALEALGSDYIQMFPIRDHSDEMMLRIMANENSDEWANAVEHGMMVTKAARDFLDGWLEVNLDRALDILRDYTGPFGVNVGEDHLKGIPSEVAIFIRMASMKVKTGAEADIRHAAAAGVDQTHVALWLGKNYVVVGGNGDNFRPSQVIRNGWAYIGMSPKRQAWVKAEETKQLAKEAEANRKAAEAMAARKAAEAELKEAEAAEAAAREAEKEAQRAADAARKAAERAKDEGARAAAAEAKRKADEAARKAADERAKAAKDARLKAQAQQEAEAKADREAKAAKAAKERDAALTEGLNRLIANGLVDPEALRLFSEPALATAFAKAMVEQRVGEHILKDEQVGVVQGFLRSYPEGKADQLLSFLLGIVRDTKSKQSILFALETDLKDRFGKMLSSQTSVANAVSRFRELIKSIKDEGDQDKMRIMVETISTRRLDIENTVTSLRVEADRLERLLK